MAEKEIRHLAYRQRFEFLVGAYMNHVRSNIGEWEFGNNYQKVLLVHRFLMDLADEGDLIFVESRICTPYSHRIKLDLNGGLWQEIDMELKNIGKE